MQEHDNNEPVLTKEELETLVNKKRPPYKMIYDARNDIMYELPNPFHPTLKEHYVKRKQEI